MTPMGRTLMVQGCASSVGKSLITAALCRILAQDGWQVAPFKAQNMGSRSLTVGGKEISAVQAMQAQAAGVPPCPEMNPILQKPITDTVAEVIVMGESIGKLSVKEYFHFKRTQGKAIVADALQRLRRRFDIIMLEGGGSPAEINLREHDLVNMGAANLADAPVLLVGDIDRGGVFAYITGTMLLLTTEERNRIKAVVINKFRGEISLLEPGLLMLEEKIRRPILGVIPHISDLCLPQAEELHVTNGGQIKSTEASYQDTYDRLAQIVRESISMDLLYEIVGLPSGRT